MAKACLNGLMSSPESESTDAELRFMRTFIGLVLLPVAFIFYFFALPVVQAMVLPFAPGGDSGPWIVRPIIAVRFCAAAFLSAMTMPIILAGPLRELWQPGRTVETICDRVHPIRYFKWMVKGCLLALLYGLALVCYLSSWTYIGPEGIKQHFLWRTVNHTYGEIRSLRTIPAGQRSESIRENGPWYCIELEGPDITLSLANEGLTARELKVLSLVVAKRSGREWRPRYDVRPR